MGTLGTPMMGTDPKDWKWQQIAEVGSFAGHPSGPFELNSKVFDEIVRNFKADGIPVSWDFEHSSEMEPTSGSIPTRGTPAQGWIHELDNRGPAGLWALVEWGDLAREYIKSGQYRFCSPAIRFNSKDRVSGKNVGARLTSVALTSNPFLKGLQPLAAKDRAADTDDAAVRLGSYAERPMRHPDGYMPALKAALRLPELATYADCSDQLERLRDCCDMADDAGLHDGVDLHDSYLRPLSAVVGMGAADVSAVLDAVQEMIDAAMARHIVEDHGGDPSAEMTDRPEPEDQTMAAADKDNHEALSLALKDAAQARADLGQKDAEITALKDSVAKLEADAAPAKAKSEELAVSLKDAQGKVAEAEKVIAAKDAEIVALKAEAAKRAEADLLADVEVAFETYKDARQLKDENKAHMLAFAKADMASFHAMYPPVDASKRHLLRQVTPVEEKPKMEDKDARPTTYQGLVRWLMSEKKMSYPAACEQASRELNDQKRK